MIPVDQTVMGKMGNCMAACIASVLEIPLEEVPECHGGVWVQRHMDWLAERNLQLVNMPITSDRRKETGEAYFFYYGYCLLTAKSPRTEGYHCVVVKDGAIVHDPHPERAAGVGEWFSYWLFVALDASKVGNPLTA
jgi:hypothetical protein